MMALFNFSLPSDTPLFKMGITCDGVSYVCRFDYSERQDRWYLTLCDSTESAIYSGLKLVANWDLLAKCVDTRRPPGGLFYADLPNVLTAEPAGFSDLGRRGMLVYVPIGG